MNDTGGPFVYDVAGPTGTATFLSLTFLSLFPPSLVV